MLIAELNRTRRIGVEVEAVIADTGNAERMSVQQNMADIFTANGLPAVARGYCHAPVPPDKALCVEYDGSLVGDAGGFQAIHFHQLEVKTRPLAGYNEFLSVVPRAVQLMSFLHCQVNRTTGLHVHLDCSEEVRTNPKFVRSLLNLTYRFEPVIYGLVAPSRRCSTYCAPMPDLRAEWGRCRSMRCFRGVISRWSRYCGLNVTHLASDNPRVEFRWHGGTLDGEKIAHWVVFLNRLLDCAHARVCQMPREQVPNTRAGLHKMMVTLGLRSNTRVWKASPELAPTRRYLIRRWKKLNPGQGRKRRGG